MIRSVLPALLAAAALAGPAAAQHAHGHAHGHAHDDKRELGAHVHGLATLSIAVEGDAVGMALAAPGADIVGFEHAPDSKADRAAVKAAQARLSAPLDLFTLPAAAGCTLAAAEVKLLKLEADGVEEIDLDHGHGHGHSHGHDHDKDGHTEFRADWRLTCTDPAAIDVIGFAFFAAFPNAMEVEVEIVSDAGARSVKVGRDAPTLALDGAI